MGSNPGPVGLGHLPSPTAWGLPAHPPRPPAGYPNRARHSEQTPWIGGPGGLGDPGWAPKCCVQIARPQKTAQDSEVTCKDKEPLFGLKLGLSDLTDTADLHREPWASPWQSFYWGREGGRTSHPGSEQIGHYSGKGVLAFWDWFLLHCVLAMKNVARVIPYLVTLSKGLLCSIMIGPGLRWCIPEEGSYSGYGAFQGWGRAQVSSKEQKSVSLKWWCPCYFLNGAQHTLMILSNSNYLPKKTHFSILSTYELGDYISKGNSNHNTVIALSKWKKLFMREQIVMLVWNIWLDLNISELY
jgi:hypothetical protein